MAKTSVRRAHTPHRDGAHIARLTPFTQGSRKNVKRFCGTFARGGKNRDSPLRSAPSRIGSRKNALHFCGTVAKEPFPLPSSPPLAPPKGKPFIRSPSAPLLRAQIVRLRRSGKKYCENFAGRGFKISALLTFPRIFGMIKKSAFCKGRTFPWRKRQRKTNRTYG